MADEEQLQQQAADVEMEEEGDSSSDSGSSSDEEFTEVEVSAQDAAALMRLEAALSENPGLYDSHVQVGHRVQESSLLRLGWVRRAVVCGGGAVREALACTVREALACMTCMCGWGGAHALGCAVHEVPIKRQPDRRGTYSCGWQRQDQAAAVQSTGRSRLLPSAPPLADCLARALILLPACSTSTPCGAAA